MKSWNRYLVWRDSRAAFKQNGIVHRSINLDNNYPGISPQSGAYHNKPNQKIWEPRQVAGNNIVLLSRVNSLWSTPSEDLEKVAGERKRLGSVIREKVGLRWARRDKWLKLSSFRVCQLVERFPPTKVFHLAALIRFGNPSRVISPDSRRPLSFMFIATSQSVTLLDCQWSAFKLEKKISSLAQVIPVRSDSYELFTGYPAILGLVAELGRVSSSANVITFFLLSYSPICFHLSLLPFSNSDAPLELTFLGRRNCRKNSPWLFPFATLTFSMFYSEQKIS